MPATYKEAISHWGKNWCGYFSIRKFCFNKKGVIKYVY